MSQPWKQLARLTPVLFVALVLRAQSPPASTLQASRFNDLLAMEHACASLLPAHCKLLIDTPQLITLSSEHTLPANISLRFQTNGIWTINGAPLLIASGLVEAPLTQQIFSGTSEIRGLNIARPEWFAPPTDLGYPAEALALAYRSTVVWGTILLNDAAYISPFEDPHGHYNSPRRFIGTTRPQLDNEHAPQQLVQGSVIRGTIIGGAALQAIHLGVDVGPWVVDHILHGHKPNGIYLPNPGGYNPKRGTVLRDIAVLSNDLDGQHSVLLEGDEGALVDGLWITSVGGTHGLVFKSANSTVRNYHCQGAFADCLIVKSDYRSSGSGFASNDHFENIDIHDLAHPGDTGGITLDARGDRMSAISFSGVSETGLTFGFNGAGSWFHTLAGVTIDHWTAHQMQGTCAAFHFDTNISIDNFVCEKTCVVPFAFYLTGRFTTLRSGEITCMGHGVPCSETTNNGVLDSGSHTSITDLTGSGLGGYLVATMPSANHSAYSGIRVLDSSGRITTQLLPARRSFMAWLKDTRAEIKPQLRVLWSTFVTAWARLFRWVMHTLTGKT